MSLKSFVAVGVLLVMPVGILARQSAAPPQKEPDFRLIVLGHFDPETLAAFRARLDEYVALREAAERGAPPLRVTENADEIIAAERSRIERIREARGGSRRGEIFAPAMAAQVKKLLVLQVDPTTLNVIMEDTPGEFDVDVNEAYPRHLPLATMPPKLLAQLPELPPDVEYRFVGRHLILRDVRANMVIDEIPRAIQCRHCRPEPEPVEEAPDR